MNKTKLKEIADWLNERRNEDGVKQLCNAPNVQLTDFGRFTKHAYELLDMLDTPNVQSSLTPPNKRPEEQANAGGGVQCSELLGDMISILNNPNIGTKHLQGDYETKSTFQFNGSDDPNLSVFCGPDVLVQKSVSDSPHNTKI